MGKVKVDFGKRRVSSKAEKGRAGHGAIYEQQLSSKEVEKLKKEGHIYRKIAGVRKKITLGNLLPTGGRMIRWYIRSDTKKPALRNYARDRKLTAKKRAPVGRKMLGD